MYKSRRRNQPKLCDERRNVECITRDDDGFHGDLTVDDRPVVGLRSVGGGISIPNADFAVGCAAVEVLSGECEGEYVGGVAFKCG